MRWVLVVVKNSYFENGCSAARGLCWFDSQTFHSASCSSDSSDTSASCPCSSAFVPATSSGIFVIYKILAKITTILGAWLCGQFLIWFDIIWRGALIMFGCMLPIGFCIWTLSELVRRRHWVKMAYLERWSSLDDSESGSVEGWCRGKFEPRAADSASGHSVSLKGVKNWFKKWFENGLEIGWKWSVRKFVRKCVENWFKISFKTGSKMFWKLVR